MIKMAKKTATRNSEETRNRLLDASLHAIRAQGYAATTIDDICAAAGLTKGSFFHHFASKEALGVAAADFSPSCPTQSPASCLNSSKREFFAGSLGVCSA